MATVSPLLPRLVVLNCVSSWTQQRLSWPAVARGAAAASAEAGQKAGQVDAFHADNGSQHVLRRERERGKEREEEEVRERDGET